MSNVSKRYKHRRVKNAHSGKEVCSQTHIRGKMHHKNGGEWRQMKGQRAAEHVWSTPHCIYWSPAAAVKIEKCLQIHPHLTVIMAEEPRLFMCGCVGGCRNIQTRLAERVWRLWQRQQPHVHIDCHCVTSPQMWTELRIRNGNQDEELSAPNTWSFARLKPQPFTPIPCVRLWINRFFIDFCV